MDEFKEIARRMKELDLQRDKTFSQPLEKDFHQTLNDKLQPKPVEKKPYPNYGDEYVWEGC